MYILLWIMSSEDFVNTDLFVNGINSLMDLLPLVFSFSAQ